MFFWWDTLLDKCKELGIQKVNEFCVSVSGTNMAIVSREEILSKMTRVGVADVTLDVTLNGTEKAVYAILRQNSESSREKIAEKVSELQIIYIVPTRTRNKIMQRRLTNETRKHQILDC